MWLSPWRFFQIELTLWQRLTFPARRLKWKLGRAQQSMVDRLLRSRRARAYLDRQYPFLRDDIVQPGQWIDDAKSPGGRKWQGQRNWRSRIGSPVVCWECGSPAYQAWNVRLPDGTRRHLRQSLYQWRRPAEPPLIWTYGRLILHHDDIEFVDLEPQPHYAPPDPTDVPNLELDLAHSSAFVADLQDDAFALTAFFVLANNELLKIGCRDVEALSSGDQIAAMIAGLRGKGETYLDVRYQTLSGRERPLERGLCTKGRIERLHRHLAMIGWRTPNPDEIKAMLREDLHQRLRARMELLRSIKEFECRPAGSYPAWREAPRHRPVPITIFRDGDDPAWLGQLTAEQQEACSGELSSRLSALATSARIDRNEHDELFSMLMDRR